MYNIINTTSENSINFKNEYTLVDLLPKNEEDNTMKSELKNFLKTQLHN